MFDVFSKVVWQADASGEFLKSSQLDALSSFVRESNKRMDLVECISSNSSSIVSMAARSLFAEQPQLIAPGGNAYTNRRMSACLRDMEVILRYVTYALFAGDSSVLEDRCLYGLRETYVALGVPGSSVALAIQKMKVITIELFTQKINSENDQLEPRILKISQIKQLYPRQWITVEVTKFENGFPSEGKIKFLDSNIVALTNKIKSQNKELYTFFSGRIDETSEPLQRSEYQTENLKFALDYSTVISELSSYFDQAAASVC